MDLRLYTWNTWKKRRKKKTLRKKSKLVCKYIWKARRKAIIMMTFDNKKNPIKHDMRSSAYDEYLKAFCNCVFFIGLLGYLVFCFWFSWLRGLVCDSHECCNCCQSFGCAHRILHLYRVQWCNSNDLQNRCPLQGQQHLAGPFDYQNEPLPYRHDNGQPLKHTGILSNLAGKRRKSRKRRRWIMSIKYNFPLSFSLALSLALSVFSKGV